MAKKKEARRLPFSVLLDESLSNTKGKGNAQGQVVG